MEQTVMILVDTNILIEIYRSNKKIIDVIKEIGQENITVSDINGLPLFTLNKKDFSYLSDLQLT